MSKVGAICSHLNLIFIVLFLSVGLILMRDQYSWLSCLLCPEFYVQQINWKKIKSFLLVNLDNKKNLNEM